MNKINNLHNKDNNNKNNNDNDEQQQAILKTESTNNRPLNENENNNQPDNNYNEADNHNNKNFVDNEENTETHQKVVRRKKTTRDNSGSRASVAKMEGIMIDSQECLTNSMEGSDDGNKQLDVNVPEWVVVGESVLIRPYNTSGVIAYIGSTHFQPGTWIGVDLDTPTGKNDGTVQGIQYFQCKPKHGIFVRTDKLILDKRGKAMRAYKAEKQSKESTMPRSRSRSEALNMQMSTGRK